VAFNHSLITMKAYPFHKGHEFLISEALRQSERVTVLLVWNADQEPDGETRAGWIRKTFPTVNVIPVVDIHTDEIDAKATGTADEERVHEASSRMWAVYALDILKGDEVDAVFSSEVYGDRWAKALGVRHIAVDRFRTYLPISGTAIRNDPYLHWSYINEHARQHYLKRVLIVGPESTGKTTMCRNLSLRYGTVYSPEYGRIYDEQTRKPKEEFDPARWRVIYSNIVNEQPKLNRRAEADARHLCFYDTDLLTTAMWYKEWQPEYGEDGLYRSILHAAKNEPPFDLVMIMPLAPWADDGYRGQTPEVRQRFYEKLMEDHKDTPWKVLEGGSWADKEAEAVRLVNSLFKGSRVTLPTP
jgi:HTH-type transcriptional repressor of NAD biosynthesis genes